MEHDAAYETAAVITLSRHVKVTWHPEALWPT